MPDLQAAARRDQPASGVGHRPKVGLHRRADRPHHRLALHRALLGALRHPACWYQVGAAVHCRCCRTLCQHHTPTPRGLCTRRPSLRPRRGRCTFNAARFVCLTQASTRMSISAMPCSATSGSCSSSSPARSRTTLRGVLASEAAPVGRHAVTAAARALHHCPAMPTRTTMLCTALHCPPPPCTIDSELHRTSALRCTALHD